MIVLASGSPRRRELLEALGIKIKVVPSGIEEEFSEVDPRAHVMLNSYRKASSVFEREGGVVLGADTVVFLDGLVLGKPRDPEEAKEHLRLLSGRIHKVYTGFCIMDGREALRSYQKVVESFVKIKALSEDEISWYVGTGEPLDKAGSYAVQGIGAYMVERIEGSYTNVMGLPMKEVVDAFVEMGILTFHQGRLIVK